MTSFIRRHLTASVFVFREDIDGGNELLLQYHKKLGHWMIPGGHVEPDEDPAEAAIREVAEETGLSVVLNSGGLTSDVGPFEDVNLVPAPSWIAVERIPATATEPAHEHIDCLFVAGAGQAAIPLPAGTRWFAMATLPTDEMFPGTVRLARVAARLFEP